MINKPITVTQPYLPPLEEFIPYLEQIWENKWLTNNGPFHQQLEVALAEYLGVEHLALFTNGTIALMTALQTLKISGEVITTPYSFVATAHSLLWNNIKPVFVDIDPATMNLDPEKIEAGINGEIEFELKDLLEIFKSSTEIPKVKPQGRLNLEFIMNGDVKDINKCDIHAKGVC